MSEATIETKSKPILFSSEMVRAILAGRKTQTRRIVKPQPPNDATDVFSWYAPHLPDEVKAPEGLWYWVSEGLRHHVACPYGKPGDRLWVREKFALSVFDPEGGDHHDDPTNWNPIYFADDPDDQSWTDGDGHPIKAPWRASIHMPKWASRITLEITDVRVERVQDISDSDAIAEGIERNVPLDADDWDATEHGWFPYCSHHPKACECFPAFDARESFSGLWKRINGPDSWKANPFVWVISFKRVEAR